MRDTRLGLEPVERFSLPLEPPQTQAGLGVVLGAVPAVGLGFVQLEVQPADGVLDLLPGLGD